VELLRSVETTRSTWSSGSGARRVFQSTGNKFRTSSDLISAPVHQRVKANDFSSEPLFTFFLARETDGAGSGREGCQDPRSAHFHVSQDEFRLEAAKALVPPLRVGLGHYIMRSSMSRLKDVSY